MLFTSITVASLLSLVAAAPTTAIDKRWPPLTNILKPTSISRYSGANGAIDYNVGTGSATKTNSGDITTLVTFDNTELDLPSECRLRFFLDGSDSAVVLEGTKQVAIYSSHKPAPVEGSKGWGGPGNQRDQDLGRFLLYKGGNGDLIQGHATKVDNFPCPKKGSGPIGFEVVPLGEVDRVEWSAAVSGLYLAWD